VNYSFKCWAVRAESNFITNGCQVAAMFVVVMRCIANKIKMSFYIDKESVFLTLKITFLWREVFVYKVQQCIKQHITNKTNNYRCKNQTHLQC